jgi:hypothetical protein
MRTLISGGSVTSTVGARRADVLVVDETIVQVGCDLKRPGRSIGRSTPTVASCCRG